MNLSDSSLQYFGLLSELIRLRLSRATLCEREENWYVAKVELERISWDAPGSELDARLAIDKIKVGYEAGTSIQSVVERAVKLDPAIVERYPELKPYQEKEHKQ